MKYVGENIKYLQVKEVLRLRLLPADVKERYLRRVGSKEWQDRRVEAAWVKLHADDYPEGLENFVRPDAYTLLFEEQEKSRW